ncbi:MAG TPA: L-lactate permease [Gemmataceae bacterium]|nr:L-lactate permease [Gemmataceae bacterium]
MIWADVYQQHLDPLARWNLPGSWLGSTVLAAVPVLVLFWLLVRRRWLAPKAAGAAAIAAYVIAVSAYGMSWDKAGLAFVNGVGYGLLPIGWTIFNAMLVYNIAVQTGHFDVVRRSVAGLSGDARIQAVLIGFAFGAFLEGAAGAGSPVAICGAIMIGLGFDPFLAAVLCLIANTSPVAYGGLGTPLITLYGVTDLPTQTLSIMAGHQLPLMSMFIPLYMVRCMCSWKKTFEIWPVLLVAGGTFAATQYLLAISPMYPMTDIAGGILALVVTAIFLRFWKPRTEWHFDRPAAEAKEALPSPLAGARSGVVGSSVGDGAHPPPRPSPARGEREPLDPQTAEAVAEAAALLGPPPNGGRPEKPLTAGRVMMAWAPFAIMSVMLLVFGLVRKEEGDRKRAHEPPLAVSGVQTVYYFAVPTLDKQWLRDRSLYDPAKGEPKPEGAEFEFAWLTAPGTPVFVAALLSMLLYRMKPGDIFEAVKRTCIQMKIPIPTIALMLGLSYVTRYAGLDATLGVAFAGAGGAYPFFGALLGWLGVFLTGTDAGSNALFGSLQKITATKVHQAGWLSQLDLGQAQVLICTANSTGGVMGKMIDAQSIVVATAATNQIGREADIFKAVIWHSILLASIVGVLTLLQAYVWPLTLMVPHLP